MRKVNIELKAKVESLKPIRRKLKELRAVYVGVFQQIDTYYEALRGRLKLRETSDAGNAELIYYEREDAPGPKKSRVWILKVGEPDAVKEMLSNIFKVKSIVNKTREIYEYEGARIHLDSVKGLGEFIEFEMEVVDNLNAVKEAYNVLEILLKRLDIPRENLQKASYSDLILSK
jgi:predicted adenylyl cyclase CyaB